MSERIRGSYDDALYKSTYTLLYLSYTFIDDGTENNDSNLFTAFLVLGGFTENKKSGFGAKFGMLWG